MTKADDRTPADLAAAGRKLWSAVTGRYDLAAHERVLLHEAARTADIMDRLAAEVANAGLTVANARGGLAPNPLLTEHRAQAATLARLLRALRLPAGIEDDAVPRPVRRRNGARPSSLRSVSP